MWDSKLNARSGASRIPLRNQNIHARRHTSQARCSSVAARPPSGAAHTLEIRAALPACASCARPAPLKLPRRAPHTRLLRLPGASQPLAPHPQKHAHGSVPVPLNLCLWSGTCGESSTRSSTDLAFFALLSPLRPLEAYRGTHRPTPHPPGLAREPHQLPTRRTHGPNPPSPPRSPSQWHALDNII